MKDGSYKINFDKIGIIPGLIENDAFQTIQALPGVESVNEKVSNINIRGGTNDQNLILWDGIRIYQAGHFFGLISAINPHQNHTVKLFKNGTPPSYGNSVSSVIELSSDKKINQDFTAELGLTFLSTDAFIDTPLDQKSSIQISARTSINNAFITPTYLQYYDRAFQNTELTANPDKMLNTKEKFYFSDVSFRWLYKLSEQDVLRLNYFSINNELKFTAEEFSLNSIQRKVSELSQSSLGMGAYYHRNWSENLATSLQLYHSNYNLNSTNSSINANTYLEQENILYENSLKITSNWALNNLFELNAGYQFITTNTKDTETETTITNEEAIKNGINANNVFSNLRYQSKDRKTVLNTGLRLNYINTFHSLLAEPRLSFNQQFFKHFSIEILGEIKNQSISQVINFQNDFLGIENRKWQLANQQTLPVTKSKQVSLGINYQKNNWLASIESYLKKVEGISSQTQGFQNQYEYAQLIGDYKILGVDLLINKKFKNFDARLSYSFTENNYYFKDLPASTIPNNFEIANSFTFASSYSYKNFKASGGLIWRSGKPFTPISANGITNNQFDYELMNSGNLKNYMRVDVSVSQEFKIQKKLIAYAGLSIWNLLDRKNIINSYYRLNNNNQVYLVNQKALGLTPNFVFRLKF
nr:TonB-dependent receptor plug domain-containing protein [Mesonia aestuariivivens]